MRGFREVLQAICAQPDQLRNRGECARNRVMTLFTWEQKAAQIGEVYEWVLGHRAAKPDFGIN